MLLGEMPNSQAHPLNHPAAIVYLKGKESPQNGLL